MNTTPDAVSVPHDHSLEPSFRALRRHRAHVMVLVAFFLMTIGAVPAVAAPTVQPLVTGLMHPGSDVARAGVGVRSAPPVAWVVASTTTSVSSSEVYGNSVSALADGSAIVAGYFSGTNIDLGDGVLRTTPSSGSDDAYFVQKIRPDGSVAWVATSTATGMSRVQAWGVSAYPDGSSIVTGWFNGTGVDLGDDEKRTESYDTFFIQRRDPSGAEVWTKVSTGNAGYAAQGFGVSVTADGGVLVTGYFEGTEVDLGDGIARDSGTAGSGSSAFTQKRNADGTVAWTQISTGGSNVAGAVVEVAGRSVSALPDGGAIVTGYFMGTNVDLGSGDLTSLNNSLFVQKRNANGTIAWTQRSAGGTNVAGQGVSAASDGSSIVTGYFVGVGVNLGDSPIVLRDSANGGNGRSVFTQRRNADGTVAWTAVSTGGVYNEALGVSVLSDGGAVVTGTFRGADVNLGDGERMSAGDGLAFSSFTQRFNSVGATTWVSTSSGGNSTGGTGISAIPDGNGSVVVTGRFSGAAVDLGDGVVRASPLDVENNFYFFAAFTQLFATAPAKPAAPVATAGDGSATVTITPVTGGPVTSYTVTGSPGGATCTITPPAVSCTISGLTNGTSYTFTVTATNAAGPSPASDPSNAVVPTAAPGPAPGPQPGPSPSPSGEPVLRVGIAMPKVVRVGRVFSVRVRVANAASRDGGSTASGMSVCVRLAPGVSVVRAKGASVSRRSVCWRNRSLAAGSRATYTVRLQASRSAGKALRVPLRVDVSAAGSSSERVRKSARGVVRVVPSVRPEPVTG